MKTKNIFYSIILAFNVGLIPTAFAQSSSCVTNADRGSQDSTCIPTVTFNQTGPSGSSGSGTFTAITPFATNNGVAPTTLASCTTPWGTTIASGSGVNAYNQAVGTYDPATGQYAADCIDEYRTCTDGVLSGSYQYENCTMGPLDGACGSANGVVYTYPTSGPPASQQCNPQYTYGNTPPANDTDPPTVPASSGAWLSGNTYTWTCAGEFGGATASCYAYRRVNGVCDPNHNNAYQCVSGTPANFSRSFTGTTSSNNPWFWWDYNARDYFFDYTYGAGPLYNPFDGQSYTYADAAANPNLKQFVSSPIYAYLWKTYTWDCIGENGGTDDLQCITPIQATDTENWNQFYGNYPYNTAPNSFP